MLYVTADLHGFPLQNFLALLKKAGFGKQRDDFLFVLGDVIDRNGDGGIETLRWLTTRSDAQLILGNHEAMLLSCQWILEEVSDSSIEALSPARMELLANWMNNGAEPTLKSLRALQKADPDCVADLLDYLQDCPLYETVHAGGREFILTHGGLGNFSPDKDLSEYTADELLWSRPSPDDRYFTHKLTVLGHTPTGYYGYPYRNRIYRTPTWVDIDTGDTPCILRLDDMAEFYAE
jgi:serine/threonine protein phosphatase 1